MSGSMRRAPAAGLANWRMRWPVVNVMDSDADDAGDVNFGSRASVSLTAVLVVVLEVGPAFPFSD
jgi:hypothetical protein